MLTAEQAESTVRRLSISVSYCQHEIDNALQHQKNTLLGALSNSMEHVNWNEQITCIDTVKQVVEMLRLNKELWIVLGYGYKGAEICTRIRIAAHYTKEFLHHRATKQLKDLNEIILSCESMAIDFNAKPHL